MGTFSLKHSHKTNVFFFAIVTPENSRLLIALGHEGARRIPDTNLRKTTSCIMMVFYSSRRGKLCRVTPPEDMTSLGLLPRLQGKGAV